MIVTTPEKYNVVTRKRVGDTELTQNVKLLIIDEVHLLNEDRGSVIESIVARTSRQFESSQSSICLAGLRGCRRRFLILMMSLNSCVLICIEAFSFSIQVSDRFH
jgi:hypothetical protein